MIAAQHTNPEFAANVLDAHRTLHVALRDDEIADTSAREGVRVKKVLA